MAATILRDTDLPLVLGTARRIGRALNDARHARKVAVRQLARDTRVAARTIFALEQGLTVNVKLGTLAKLFNELGLEVTVVEKAHQP